ncbi:MAG TPA: hypothetical protein VMV05_12410 [bacterium]|nr:hypothetical protein [bacterium]
MMKSVFRKHRRRHSKAGNRAHRSFSNPPAPSRSVNPLFRAAHLGQWFKFAPLRIY